MTLIKNGLIHDAVREEAYRGDILIENGKIIAVGQALPTPEGTEVFDASGLSVYPGFVEAHGHLGLEGHGIGFEGEDVNEMNDILTPQLRAIDGVNPMDPCFRDARNAGVTCVCVGPGSANVLGGTFTAIKTVGDNIDEMTVTREVAMKCAFGENPKRCYESKCDSTRMTTAAKLREMLFKAREYNEKIALAGEDRSKLPAFDMKLNALLPVIRGEMPLKAHAHQADDLLTALRIAKEFGVKITLEHCTEGHLIASYLAKAGAPLAVGPTLTHATKFELRYKTWETPALLAKAGCQVSIITDSPVIPQMYLALCAGLAMKSGLSEFDALKAITINPAKHIGIANRVGSIEKGKDADIVLTDGSPFEVATLVKAVFIDGKRVDG